MYLPLNHGAERKYIVKIKMSKLCAFTVSLPLVSFITCIIMTMYKDFENANNTHCKVPNIFPSISASIGNYEPQSTIWRTAIFVHAPIRCVFILQMWKYFRHVIYKDYAFLVNLAVVLNVIENGALMGLTYWTSKLHYPYHEVCFKLFIGASILYMLFVCLLLTKYRRKANLTRTEMYSLKMKWRMFVINVSSFAFAAYFFIRHNKLCEAYVYSMFGFAEYVVVISNICFHLTTAYDFPTQYLYLTKSGIMVE